MQREVTSDYLLTIDEAAERLRVSRWSVYNLIRANQLRTVKIGRRQLVTPAALTRVRQATRREGGVMTGAGAGGRSHTRRRGQKRANGEGTIYQRKDGRWEGAAFVLTTAGTYRRAASTPRPVTTSARK